MDHEIYLSLIALEQKDKELDEKLTFLYHTLVEKGILKKEEGGKDAKKEEEKKDTTA